jgi:alpha-tubulin suppressor-like RCC1 family protein
MLTEEDYLRIFRNLGHYWFSKGKGTFADFIGVCLNSLFEVTNMWTADYATFLEEGDVGIGTSIVNGGTWYPTTHVMLNVISSRYASFPVELVTQLFYDFANYNLVLYGISLTSTLHVVVDAATATLWGSGANANHLLSSSGSTGTDYPPVLEVGVAENWSVVDTGDGFAYGLRGDGTLWAWGDNTYGKLGQGNTTALTTPTQVGVSTNWTKVSCGANHVLALKSDGTLWGCGYYPGLGLGAGNHYTMTQIGAATSWIDICSGLDISVGRQADGTLWTVGIDPGAAGIGGPHPTTWTKYGVGTDWVYAYVSRHTDGGFPSFYGIKSDGTLWAAGGNANAQLKSAASAWVQLTNVYNTYQWSKAVCDDKCSYGVDRYSRLYGWGVSTNGSIGDGTTTTVTLSAPKQIGHELHWVRPVVSGQLVVASKDDGSLWTWGYYAETLLGLDAQPNHVVTAPTRIGDSDKWSSFDVVKGAHTVLGIQQVGSPIVAENICPIIHLVAFEEIEQTIANF